MKNKLTFLLLIFLLVISSCRKTDPMLKIIDETLRFSLSQYSRMADVMKERDDLPRSINSDGFLITAKSNWWTSGFFPGSLWYLFEYSNDSKMKADAIAMTSRIESEKNNKGTHDLGFMLYCSFGNGLRLGNNGRYEEVLVTGARSLATRFNPLIGCIQSWNSNSNWQYPVIIDNMMNLEFLMWAFKNTGDSTFYDICISHSDTTIKNHFRPDYSSYHVVSYDTVTGKVEKKQTHQGAADESAWSRGQAWSLYGYVVMYRETGIERYLDQAIKIAGFMIDHPNMPDDMIPYWDFNAPGIPDARRDASAAAITASALIELSGMVDTTSAARYLQVAKTQILTLASPEYLSNPGENGNFILKHGVGNLPGNSEVDVPLTYGDYYFIEALIRYRRLLI